MPFASYADDLQTIFSLTHGYLRVVWSCRAGRRLALVRLFRQASTQP